MFEIAASPSSASRDTAKGALSAGSSKQGKAVRAELASNWVTAAARRTEVFLRGGLELFFAPPPTPTTSPSSPSISSSSSVQVLRYRPSSASGSA